MWRTDRRFAAAYVAALKLLGRRELSEAQVRQRLARRAHDPDAIDAAVARLLDERAIDDRRVADAIARTETGVRRRGKLRVLRKIESAGIAAATAKRAVDAVFDGSRPGRTARSRAPQARCAAATHVSDRGRVRAPVPVSRRARASNQTACSRA